MRYRGLRVGWVDCASFAIMEELGLRHYFGFDDDFVRAGFVPYQQRRGERSAPTTRRAA